MTPDDEFAAFVFHHFGGYWTNRWPEVDIMARPLAKLPERIRVKVVEMARAYREERDSG